MSQRRDESFAYQTAAQFNPFGEQQPISFDFNLASQYAQPHYRSKPRVSYIRPPSDLPFDGKSFNGLFLGAAVVAAAVLGYFFIWPRVKKYVK